MRTCERCGTALPVHKGAHRPRKFCTDCRPPQRRDEIQPERVTEIRPGASVDGLSLVAATTTRLADSGRLGTPEAVLVLNLAKSIDDGGHSGASLASLSTAYSKALAAATAGVAEVKDEDVSWGVG